MGGRSFTDSISVVLKGDNHNEQQEFPHSAASCNTLARLVFNIKLRPCVSDDLVLALAWVGSFWSGSHRFCARRRNDTKAQAAADCRIIRGKSDVSTQCTQENEKQETGWQRRLDSNSWLRFAGSSW